MMSRWPRWRKAVDSATGEHVVRYVLVHGGAAVFAVNVQVYSHGKVQIDETIWFGTLPESWTMTPPLLICGLWVWLVVVGVRRAWTRSEWALASRAGLIAGIGLGQAALIVLGRMNLRSSPVVLALNSHYTYIGLLFALACSAAALSALRTTGSRLDHAAGGLHASGFVHRRHQCRDGVRRQCGSLPTSRPQRKWFRSCATWRYSSPRT